MYRRFGCGTKLRAVSAVTVGVPAADPVYVWARVGVGTRWLVAVEDAECERHGHPGGESFTLFEPDQGNNHSSCHEKMFISGLCLDSKFIQQVVDIFCVKIHCLKCCRHI